MSQAPSTPVGQQADEGDATGPVDQGPLVMYVILRKDLASLPGWGMGSIINQACHATAKAVHVFREHPAMRAYLADVDHMHKVTLEVKNEAKLREVARLLDAHPVDYVSWTEEPEGICTCLATRPYHKGEVAVVLRQAKTSLYRG